AKLEQAMSALGGDCDTVIRQALSPSGRAGCALAGSAKVSDARFRRLSIDPPPISDISGCPETVARRGQAPAGIDHVGVMDQVSPPAKISFLITAWTPQFPSTTWVMPKSTPIVIKEIASSSVSFLVVIRNLRILRNASRKARSTDDFE